MPEEIKGIKMMFLDNNNDIVVITHPLKLWKFDFSKNQWIFIKNFYYNFDKIY